MELNNDQPELPSDDFFPLMDINEDVDLFDIQDEPWIDDAIQVSATVIAEEGQFSFEPEMNLQVGMDINPLDLVVIQDEASSDIESISSVEDTESPQKSMKLDASASFPSLLGLTQPSKKEAFNAQKRLEELRKLPVVERQREARKRHRANHALVQANKLVEEKNRCEGTNAVAPSSSMLSSVTGRTTDNDDITGGDFNLLSQKEAELIAKTTERNLIALGIDPDSKEGKKQRRKIRNRMSAQLHRERKKEYIDALEAKVKDRDVIINQLQSKIKLLINENEKLKKQMNLPLRDLSSSCTSSTAGTSSASVSDSSDTDDVSVSVNDTDGSLSPMESSNVPNISTLFSVFIMFGMTFWNAPAPINRSMPPGFSNPNFQFTQLSLPSPQERHYNTGNNEVSIFHSRRRLSLTSSDTEYNSNGNIEGVDSSSFNTGPLIPLSNINMHSIEKNDLWSYESYDKIAQLYPLEISRRPTLQTGKPTLRTSTRPSSNNLRKRVVTGNDSATATSTSARDYVPHGDKKIYGTMPSSSALSRIVVTSGKALLDPKMTKNPTDNVKKTGQNDVHDDNSKSIVPIISHADDSVPFSSYFINYIRDDEKNVDPKTRQLALKETSEFGEDKNGDPMLMMLLPASVVQWGTQWSNDIKQDDKNSFKNFMRNHNINGSDFDERENGKDTSEISDYFIEIGCSVFKAQLVKNVTIM